MSRLDVRFDKEIRQMRDAELASVMDIYVRYAFFLVYGMVVCIATNDGNIIGLCVTYILANATYCFALARTTFPVKGKWFGLLLALNATSTFTLITLSLYLISFEQVEIRLTGFVVIICYAFFNVSRNTSYSIAAVIHTIALVFFGLALLFVEVPRADSMMSQAILCLAVSVTTIYYLMAQWHTIKMHASVELANEREVHNQKVKAVGRLTGGVAHDFNNLLTVIKGNLELYSELEDPNEREHSIDEAYHAASRAADVVKQLLAFTRQTKLEPSEIILEDWCGSFENLTKRLLPEPIALQVGPIDPEAKVFADQGQLSSAILNLVLNSRDAIKDVGQIKLQISTIEGPVPTRSGLLQGQKYVRMSVTDNGHGISKENLSKITDPFFTTKAVGKGSGLGLSMAHGFAAQSGGALELNSEPSTGTRACLLLPAAT